MSDPGPDAHFDAWCAPLPMYRWRGSQEEVVPPNPMRIDKKILAARRRRNKAARRERQRQRRAS